MRYLGCKTLLTNQILDVINKETENVHTISDVFSGTGIVAKMLKTNNFNVNTNDHLYFSYVLCKGTLEMSCQTSNNIHELVCHLNNLSIDNCKWFDKEKAFIYKNYSPNKDCDRMYFQNSNAIKIDLIRQELERLKSQITESEYFYLLSLLLNAVPYVSNITGTYGAYLKYWDKRTFNTLALEEFETINNNSLCRCFNLDVMEFAHQVKSDLAYLDPPYNGRQYISNYHILETIALYDNPAIKGKTGMRIDSKKSSDFCKKEKVKGAFEELFKELNTRYILLSYNNEGLVSTDEMTELLKNCGYRNSFQLYEYPYRRYKNKIPNNKDGLKEQLYFVRKDI